MEAIIKKLRFKESGVIINAPAIIEKSFLNRGFTNNLSRKITATNSLFFINNREEFIGFLKNDLQYIKPDSVLWFAYPKGTSGIKTDINRDIIRETGEEYGITTVAAISIDEIWSALRFRPIDQVGK